MINHAIIDGLQQLGIKRGDVVLVHSSMKALGITDGPACVIESLQQCLGKEGTLLMPALTYSTSCASHFFSYHDTPVCVGLIPETFRKMPGVIRSLHPTHSVCAWGSLAGEITAKHQTDHTPVGEHSPFRQLPALHGKIIMLGCGLNPNTFMHGVEEVAAAPYLLKTEPELFTLEDQNRNVFQMSVRCHDISRHGRQNYARAADLLGDQSLRTGRVCQAETAVIDAGALMRSGVEAILRDPFYFINKY